jgi:hypothetical protein
MKGGNIEAELDQVPLAIQARTKVVPISIPGLEMRRQAVIFQN